LICAATFLILSQSFFDRRTRFCSTKHSQGICESALDNRYDDSSMQWVAGVDVFDDNSAKEHRRGFRFYRAGGLCGMSVLRSVSFSRSHPLTSQKERARLSTANHIFSTISRIKKVCIACHFEKMTDLNANVLLRRLQTQTDEGMGAVVPC